MDADKEIVQVIHEIEEVKGLCLYDVYLLRRYLSVITPETNKRVV